MTLSLNQGMVNLWICRSTGNFRLVMILHGLQIDFDDSKWDKITVPSSWENQGFRGYNGYAWYRVSFEGSTALVLKKTSPFIWDILMMLMKFILMV